MGPKKPKDGEEPRSSVLENQSQASVDLLESPLSGISDEDMVQNTPDGEVGKMVVVGPTPDEEYEVKRDKPPVGIDQLPQVLKTLHSYNISAKFIHSAVDQCTGTKGETVYIVTAATSQALPRAALKLQTEIMRIPKTRDYIVYVTGTTVVQELKNGASEVLFYDELKEQADKLAAELEPKLVEKWTAGLDFLLQHYETNPCHETFEVVVLMVAAHQSSSPTLRCSTLADKALTSIVTKERNRTGIVPVVNKSMKKLRLPKDAVAPIATRTRAPPRIEQTKLVFKSRFDSPTRRVTLVESESESEDVSPLRVRSPPSKRVRFNPKANDIAAIFESDDSDESYSMSQELPALRKKVVAVDSTPLKLKAQAAGKVKTKVLRKRPREYLTKHLEKKEEIYEEDFRLQTPSKLVDDEIKLNEANIARLAKLAKKKMRQKEKVQEWSKELQVNDDEDEDEDENSVITLLEEFNSQTKNLSQSKKELGWKIAKEFSKMFSAETEDTPKPTKKMATPSKKQAVKQPQAESDESSESEDVREPKKPAPKKPARKSGKKRK